MSKIKVSLKSTGIVNLEKKIIWEKLVSFGGTEKFVPDLIEKVIVQGNGIGAIRNIYLKGGGEIVEKLTLANENKLELKFIILSTPMPVYNYEGIFNISSINDTKSEVEFESIYEVLPNQENEMNGIIKNFQEIFISNLDK